MKTKEQIKNGVCERVRDVIRRKHMSLETERAYVGWVCRFFDFCLDLPRDMQHETKMERFLTYLAKERDVSASTQMGAFHAIRFLYTQVLDQPLDVQKVKALRATRPDHVRHAPSVEDTLRLLDDVQDVSGYPSRLVVQMLYACGMRVSEPLNLRVKELRFSRREIYVLGAKGKKDRVVRMPETIIDGLQRQLSHARTIWERDQQAGIPVELPHQLARKYPEYQHAWQWAYVFPMHRPCKHPRRDQIVRWHMMANIVQIAVKESRRRLGIAVVPHELRHAYGTHCLDRGVNIKALSESMGHKQIQTTVGYCHADALSVESPLDIARPKVLHPPIHIFAA